MLGFGWYHINFDHVNQVVTVLIIFNWALVEFKACKICNLAT